MVLQSVTPELGLGSNPSPPGRPLNPTAIQSCAFPSTLSLSLLVHKANLERPNGPWRPAAWKEGRRPVDQVHARHGVFFWLSQPQYGFADWSWLRSSPVLFWVLVSWAVLGAVAPICMSQVSCRAPPSGHDRQTTRFHLAAQTQLELLFFIFPQCVSRLSLCQRRSQGPARLIEKAHTPLIGQHLTPAPERR
jgi:hypothetical protein